VGRSGAVIFLIGVYLCAYAGKTLATSNAERCPISQEYWQVTWPVQNLLDGLGVGATEINYAKEQSSLDAEDLCSDFEAFLFDEGSPVGPSLQRDGHALNAAGCAKNLFGFPCAGSIVYRRATNAQPSAPLLHVVYQIFNPVSQESSFIALRYKAANPRSSAAD
jgi:hypothetical protein